MMDSIVKTRKKLIEVALPLIAINTASVNEKQPFTRNHPRSIHIWWARRPLAAARAVIFAQMVDDPSEYVDVLRADAKLRRKAEAELKAKLKLWNEATEFAAKAARAGTSAPAPGPEPTLDDILADRERASGSSHHRGPRAVGKHDQRDGLAGARRDMAKLATGLC